MAWLKPPRGLGAHRLSSILAVGQAGGIGQNRLSGTFGLPPWRARARRADWPPVGVQAAPGAPARWPAEGGRPDSRRRTGCPGSVEGQATERRAYERRVPHREVKTPHGLLLETLPRLGPLGPGQEPPDCPSPRGGGAAERCAWLPRCWVVWSATGLLGATQGSAASVKSPPISAKRYSFALWLYIRADRVG